MRAAVLLLLPVAHALAEGRLGAVRLPAGGCVADVADGLRALAVGGAYGYAGWWACDAALHVAGGITRVARPTRRKSSACCDIQHIQRDDATDTLAGRWLFDVAASESLEPFLVAVGAPRIIAKMVGRKGKPMEIGVEQAAGGTISLRVNVEGKDSEYFSTAARTDVRTPRGVVIAQLEADLKRQCFVVTKDGPSKGETTTERRELSEDRQRLKCTFTHTSADGTTVTVVRYYTRAYS